MPPPPIAVVIPTLNEAGGIATVISELLEGLPSDRETCFYIADGGSSDGTPAIVEEIAARDSRVRLIANPGRLQSAAVNLVARLAEGWAGYLVRCDAHASYPRGFVARVVESLERSGADSVVVPMDSVGHTCTGRAIAWASDTRVGSGGSAHRGGRASGFVDHGHHAGWLLESFRRAGGYDEDYSHNEDAEFDCRLRGIGGLLWLDATIRLTYFVRPTLGALWRQYRNYGRGRSRTVRRHPGSLRLRQLAVPCSLAANMLAMIGGLFFRPLLVLPLLYLAILAVTSVQVTVRHRSACGLLAGPAAFVMHVAWAIGFLEGMIRIREARWRQGELLFGTRLVEDAR